MGNIMKVTLSVILILFMTFIAVGMIGGNNDADAADAYLQRCSAELQICNFDDTVIITLQTEAASNGYTLTVDKKTDLKGDVQYAIIELTYKYKVPIIGLESEHIKTIIAK